MTVENAHKILQKATATFAGGCFWCMQSPFDAKSGVLEPVLGYTGGSTENPTYKQVSAGDSGHAESIQVIYDPAIVGYKKNPIRYKFYRRGCRRDKRLAELWETK